MKLDNNNYSTKEAWDLRSNQWTYSMDLELVSNIYASIIQQFNYVIGY